MKPGLNDRATATAEELDAAIKSVRPGEPLTITENGKPRMQIVIPAPVVDECCVDTAARIVGWLRAEGARRWANGEDDGIPSHCDVLADAIERGDWKANGGRDG